MTDHDILLIRTVGGCGDVLAMRMMLHDFKKAHPGSRLALALPHRYWDLVIDHEDVDQLVTPSEVCAASYPISYELSTPCGAYEYRLAPKADLNRADIWATACGVEIQDHSMRFKVSEDEKEFGRSVLGEKPTVALCPRSSTKARDLTTDAATGTAKALLARGYNVVLLHSEPVPGMPAEVSQLTKLTTRQLIGVASQLTAAVTVETSHSHLLGGLSVPTVHVYSVGDGNIYCKYYKNCIVLQDHEPGTYNCFPDASKITADRIMAKFDELPLRRKD